jgi:hypothetical protein
VPRGGEAAAHRAGAATASLAEEKELKNQNKPKRISDIERLQT